MPGPLSSAVNSFAPSVHANVQACERAGWRARVRYEGIGDIECVCKGRRTRFDLLTSTALAEAKHRQAFFFSPCMRAVAANLAMMECYNDVSSSRCMYTEQHQSPVRFIRQSASSASRNPSSFLAFMKASEL